MKWTIIKHFSGRNVSGFSFQDVAEEFPEKNPMHLARILARMVKAGMLRRLTWDKYHIIPLNANPETYVPSGFQVVKYMMQNREYYVGYGSAMKIHGLTLQGASVGDHSEAGMSDRSPEKSRSREKSPLPERVYVVTQKQVKPAIRSFGQTTCRFIQHNDARFFGFSDMWINQFEKAMVSDLEKTIVDIATKPGFCGGIFKVGNAVFRAQERTDHDKLFYYFARNRNKSAKKRFLFLTDLLGLKWTADHERMMGELGSGISLLDPVAPEQGKNIGKFGLKMNVDPIYIRKEVLQNHIS